MRTSDDFSIIITSHNQARFIDDAVQSALRQRSPAKEIIVVDDASTDDSLSLLGHYGAAISLVRLQTNCGANIARNKGASLASGEYLVFLDGDDVMLPWALEVYGFVVKSKNPKLVLSNLHYFTGPIERVHVDEPQAISCCEYPVLMEKDRAYRASASAMIIHKPTFLDVGGWTEDIFPMEDLDLLVKLGYSGRTVQILSPATIYYRVHEANTVKQVAACIGMLHCILKRAGESVYANEKRRLAECGAFLGGPSWFWVKRATRTGFYREAIKLFLHSWRMIVRGTGRRLMVKIRKPRPVESMPFGSTTFTVMR